jgi:hypothetical protein
MAGRAHPLRDVAAALAAVEARTALKAVVSLDGASR